MRTESRLHGANLLSILHSKCRGDLDSSLCTTSRLASVMLRHSARNRISLAENNVFFRPKNSQLEANIEMAWRRNDIGVMGKLNHFAASMSLFLVIYGAPWFHKLGYYLYKYWIHLSWYSLNLILKIYRLEVLTLNTVPRWRGRCKESWMIRKRKECES